MSLEDLHTEQPEVYQRLMEAVNNLELHFKDAQVCNKWDVVLLLADWKW